MSVSRITGTGVPWPARNEPAPSKTIAKISFFMCAIRVIGNGITP